MTVQQAMDVIRLKPLRFGDAEILEACRVLEQFRYVEEVLQTTSLDIIQAALRELEILEEVVKWTRKNKPTRVSTEGS